ncbi:MAG: 2,3-bisphosphoglycerate-independent phosphoglycerate mutase [Acidobacteriota bacterium]|nr:MAG: 2,3-bisphosphoglycerate-independent phosphoglycerate mutase [Acidobacteriota bacterium]
MKKRPVALIILDGFGHSEKTEGNAIALAKTPFLDQYYQKYRHTLMEGSGERVGLPCGQFGNSEVGHLNMGAGRIVQMDITRIDSAIRSGKFFENPTLVAAVDAGRNTSLHLMGLVSDGGVHSINTHIYALLELAARRGVERVFLHCFTDGRDTPPNSGKRYLEELNARMREIGVGRVATVCGRYYAMDRDNRWERVKRAYDALTLGIGSRMRDPIAGVEASYEKGVTDEFIDPIVVTEESGEPMATIKSGDSVIFFNFRADRARQLTRAFTGLNFDGFEREKLTDLHYATFTQYDRSFTTPIVFPPISLKNILVDVFAQTGVENLRVAETEKYAHVTYFFNGGVEKEFPHERRILVPSPKVATYDLQPEMSALKVTDQVCREIDEGRTDVYIINFANADMVGHTGNLEAAIQAVEVLDTCLGWVIGSIERVKGAAIVTADHGNCEQMIDPETGGPHTAHTSNPVPFILCDPDFKGTLREMGALEDIAPTILELLGVEKPVEMTGRSLMIHE